MSITSGAATHSAFADTYADSRSRTKRKIATAVRVAAGITKSRRRDHQTTP